MSELEDNFAEIVRRVVREELERVGRVPEALLTSDQVAAMLGYTSREAVYKLKKEGKLKPVYLGDQTVRFEPEEVRRFIRESQVEPEKTLRAVNG